MSVLRTYGCILVSSGLFVTGTLWYARHSSAVRGEDMAEVLAAVTERSVIPFTFGTNAPAWPTNVVSSVPEWSVYYRSALCGARALVTNTPDALPAVLWLDASLAAPADGGTLSDAGYTWSVVSTNVETFTDTNLTPRTVYHWAPAAVTNAQDKLPTLASRMPSSGKVFWPLMPATNAPLSPLLYAVARSNAWLDASWPAGNGWSAAGVSSNVYKFGCERWNGMGGTPVSIASAQGGFLLSTNQVSIPYGHSETRSVTVSSAVSSTNRLYAALYACSATNFAAGSFAVTDGGGSVWALNLTLSAKYLTVSEGGTATLTLHPAAQPPARVYPCTITVYGDGVTAQNTVYPYTSFSFGPGNWNVNQTLQVSVSDDAVAAPRAAVVKLSYRGEDNYIAVGITDNDGAARGVTLSPALTVLSKGGSASVSVGLGSDPTNLWITAGRAITTNGLNEAMKVLQSLTRSVHVFAPDALSFASNTWYSGGYSWATNTGYLATDPAVDLSSAVASGFSGISETAFSTNHAWDGTLATFSADASKIHIRNKYSEGGAWYYSDLVDISMTYGTAVLSGCRLPVPCDYACASGYVSKVTVYAVATVPHVAKVKASARLNEDENTTENYSADTVQPDAQNSVTLGLDLDPCPLRNPPQTLSDTLSRFDSAAGYCVPSSVVLSKLCESESPASSPSFTLGIRSLTFPSSSMHGVRFEKVEYYSGTEWQRATEDNRACSHSVSVAFFVVVVDWSWKHLNPSTPFAPAAYTPEWAATNTP